MTGQPNWGMLMIQGRALDIGVPLPPEFNTVEEYEAVHGKYRQEPETFKKPEPKPEDPKAPEAPKANDAIPTIAELNELKAKELVEILTQMGVKATTFMGKPKLIEMVIENSK